MSLQRGDVVLAWFPFASGSGGKRRPCVVIQNDEDNQKIANTIVIQITTVLTRLGDKSHVFVGASTTDGKQSGLLHDSLISCNNMATIEQNLIQKVIGTLSAKTMREVEEGLMAALHLP